MDDDAVGAVQARLTRHAADSAGVDTDELWWEYFQLGGEAGSMEVDAYLHGCLRLPPAHRDLVARAANELADSAPRPRVPLTRELTGAREDAGEQKHDRSAGPRPRD